MNFSQWNHWVKIRCAAIKPAPGLGHGAFAIWPGKNTAAPQRKWYGAPILSWVRPEMRISPGERLRNVRIPFRGAQIGP